jgi:serine/threonine protein kinase
MPNPTDRLPRAGCGQAARHVSGIRLATPYVEDGASLADVGKPMATGPALQLVIRLLAALQYAHERGVVHRDVKPSNILLPEPDWPLLADFGIAKTLEQTGDSLTAVGQVIGTAAYMAPEQAAGEPVDARTDLYAVGVLLFELVTGQTPFGAGPRSEVLPRHTTAPPPPGARIAHGGEQPEALPAALARRQRACRAGTRARANAHLADGLSAPLQSHSVRPRGRAPRAGPIALPLCLGQAGPLRCVAIGRRGLDGRR